MGFCSAGGGWRVAAQAFRLGFSLGLSLGLSLKAFSLEGQEWAGYLTQIFACPEKMSGLQQAGRFVESKHQIEVLDCRS